MRLERFVVGDELVKLGRKLNLLVDYCKAITPKSGENTRIRQTHAGAYISADKSPTGGSGSAAADSSFVSVSYTGDGVYAITMNELQAKVERSQDLADILVEVSSVTFNIDFSSAGTVSIWLKTSMSDGCAFFWTGPAQATGADAGSIAAKMDYLYNRDGIIKVADVYTNATGYFLISGINEHPDIQLSRWPVREAPYFAYGTTGGSIKSIFLRNAYVHTSSGSVPNGPSSVVADADGLYNVYVGWDSSTNAWKLATSSGSLSSEVLIGSVNIVSGAIESQRMRTGQLTLPDMGTSVTRNFTDGSGNSHSVQVAGGLIKSWTVT